MPHRIAYHVAPRYSCGSPAQVDEKIARRVIEDEKEAFQAHLEGVYGPEAQHLAQQRGLSRIVYSTLEKRNKQFVKDEMTDEHWEVPNRHWTGRHWYDRSDTDQFRVRMES
jgi:hypothetical protein